ncbi:ABC transporter ATP-binding protein (plasmid) [Haloimpatiens sp. FM7330]|uniref:ABC transporter ATP-binding protein n=1 Tax=Haloimpatiens sp. FM7330 TaxID=3298610 RepID=UPI00362834E3
MYNIIDIYTKFIIYDLGAYMKIIKSSQIFYKSFKKNLKYLIGLCLIFILGSFFSVYPTRLLGDIINNLSKKSHNSYNVKFLIILYIIIRIIYLSLNIFGKYFQEYLSSKMQYELRTDSILNITNINMIDFNNLQSTQFVTRIFDAITQLVTSIINIVVWIGKSLTTLMFTFYFLFKIDVTITLIFIPLVFFMAIFTKKISRKTKLLSKDEAEKSSYVRDLVQEIVSSFREIKCYPYCKEWILNKYNQKEDNWRRSKVRFNFLSSAIFWLLSFFGIVVVSIILIMAIQKTANNTLATGDITALLLYSGNIFVNIMEVFNQFINFKTLEVVIERFNEIMSKSTSKEKTKCILNNYDIEFKNVSFSYNGTNTILNNINLKIPFGKSISIIGESGSGKSTILKLILGLYETTSGEVKIGDININDLSREDIKKNITCIFQNTFLYNSSIHDNIVLGREENIESLNEVLGLSCSTNFINKFSNKLDTIVGERGSNLSGGQQQRLGIARGFLDGGKIILLDEISAALDTITEQHIIENIKKIQNKTLVVVSHKPNMIRWTDYAVVIDNGEIVDIGTHDELLKRCPLYLKFMEDDDIVTNSI